MNDSAYAYVAYLTICTKRDSSDNNGSQAGPKGGHKPCLLGNPVEIPEFHAPYPQTKTHL